VDYWIVTCSKEDDHERRPDCTEKTTSKGWPATVANDEDGETHVVAGITDDDVTQQGDDP
jgi:hypothetical protein